MNKRLIIVLGILLSEVEAQEFRPVNFNIDEIIDQTMDDVAGEPEEYDDDIFLEFTSAEQTQRLQELLQHKEWHDHLPLWVKKFGVTLLIYIAEIREYCVKNWYRIRRKLQSKSVDEHPVSH